MNCGVIFSFILSLLFTAEVYANPPQSCDYARFADVARMIRLPDFNLFRIQREAPILRIEELQHLLSRWRRVRRGEAYEILEDEMKRIADEVRANDIADVARVKIFLMHEIFVGDEVRPLVDITRGNAIPWDQAQAWRNELVQRMRNVLLQNLEEHRRSQSQRVRVRGTR